MFFIFVIFKTFLFLIVCVCLFVWYGYVQVPEESRRDVGCPEAEITGSCETPDMEPGYLNGSSGKSEGALTHRTISQLQHLLLLQLPVI